MRRRRWIGIVVIAALAGAAGWYAWRRYTAPMPPQVAHEGIDPELSEAIQTGRRKIQADPYGVQGWGDLGKLLRAARLFPEAAVCFAQAERLDPKNPRWPYMQGEALRLIDTDAALLALQRAAALAASPPFTPRSGGEGGGVAPFLRLAEVCIALGRNDEAEKQLHRALEMEPDDPTVHYHLGLLALSRDELSASLDHLKRGEQSPYTQRKACIQLAAVYRRMGRTKEADEYSRKADTLPADRNWTDPFLSDVFALGRPARLDEIDRLERRGDYRTAVDQLNALIQGKPEYRLYVILGRYLYKLGDFDRAEQALRAALSLDAEKFAAHHEMGRVWWTRANNDERTYPERARAEYEQAAACVRRALASKPDHAMSHVILGMSLRRLGKRDEAVDAFRTAVLCAPHLPLAHLYLGETLAEAGQMAEARAALERARELSPDDPAPRAALAKLRE